MDAFDLHGHPDGFVVTFEGHELAVFPSFLGAASGLRAARAAHLILLETLASANSRKDA